MLTDLYNQNYLDVVLVRNSFDKKYHTLYMFQLKNFSNYNKNNSWQKGDEILKEIALVLMTCADEPELFRVFGDDFILLDNESCDAKHIKKSIDAIIDSTEILCELKSLNLVENSIERVSDLEGVF